MPTVTDRAAVINILWWNTKGVNNPVKRKRILTHLKTPKAEDKIILPPTLIPPASDVKLNPLHFTTNSGLAL